VNRQLKKRWVVLAIEVWTVFPLLILGLIFSPWFMVVAVLLWFAFVIYQSFIAPGGPW
jgi:hypothetical protein